TEAVAHAPSILQHVVDRHEPVGDVETHEAAGGARDLVEDFGIPPDVIDVSHDADGGWVESLREAAGLAQRRNAGALGGKRRVQGLDPEAYSALLSVRDQLGDAVGDHAARRRDVLIGRGAAYQDEDI